MRILITGSSGHLGEALVRMLRWSKHEFVSLDINPSWTTNTVGSIVDRDVVKNAMRGVNAVLHTATLHKPHVATHTRRQFIDTNITGTLNLLEEAVAAGVDRFIFTSTTSAFGAALTPPLGAPAAWITEEVKPVPRNIYGVTKVAAEDLCELFHRNHKLPCIILRTSRFFPEPDDNPDTRAAYDDLNAKANEFLYRRVEIEDVVGAHLLAVEKAPSIGFARYIISATTPFTRDDLMQLRTGAHEVVKRYVPDFEPEYAKRGWRMFPEIDRVYINEKARRELGWNPSYDFAAIMERLKSKDDPRSLLAQEIGSKGYHRSTFKASEGPYPIK